jgi:hypothetical protein
MFITKIECGYDNTVLQQVCPPIIRLASVCVDHNLLDVSRSIQRNTIRDGGEKSVSSPESRQASITEIQIVVDMYITYQLQFVFI